MRFYVLKDRVPVPVTQDDYMRDCTQRNALGVQVTFTQVGCVRVSTVFLGYDVSQSGSPVPTLFETKVFGGRYDEFQWRYQTIEGAEECHKHIVTLVRVEHDEFERIYRAGSAGC